MKEKKLNMKQMTRVTARIYDSDLALTLNNLYRMVGGTQNQFFNTLIREGCKAMTEKLEHPLANAKAAKDAPVCGEELKDLFESLRSLIKASYQNQKDDMDGIKKEMEIALAMLSCLYHVTYYGSMDIIQDQLDQGTLDSVPSRLKKGGKR